MKLRMFFVLLVAVILALALVYVDTFVHSNVEATFSERFYFKTKKPDLDLTTYRFQPANRDAPRVKRWEIHSWYDSDCCSVDDCRPVPATDVQETEGGWLYRPMGLVFKDDVDHKRIRPSQDRNFHVCIGRVSGRALCIYILSGA